MKRAILKTSTLVFLIIAMLFTMFPAMAFSDTENDNDEKYFSLSDIFGEEYAENYYNHLMYWIDYMIHFQ